MPNKLQLLGYSCTSWVYATFLGESIQRVDCVATISLPPYTFTGPKFDALLRCQLKWPFMNCAVCRPKRQSWKSLFLSKKERNWTWMISVKLLFCMYYHFSVIISLNYGMAQCGWTMAKSWRSACMWAGQRVLCLLQDPFKQSKLSLMLTLARGKCWGSCYSSNNNWDSWALHIALHASRDVARRLKRLETVLAIEHSVVVNGRKNSGNSYYWSQVTTLLIRRSMKSTYTLYGTPSKFYPSPHTWCHYASRPFARALSMSLHLVRCSYAWVNRSLMQREPDYMVYIIALLHLLQTTVSRKGGV